MGAKGQPRATNLACEPARRGLEKFILYQTLSHLYLVGCDKRQSEYRVLKVMRSAAYGDVTLNDLIQEDYCAYSKAELKEMLEMIHEGNRMQGGLTRVATGYGILGFVRFLDCYYVVIVTQRRKVGQIGGNTVYGIKASEMLPIKPEKSVSGARGENQSLIKSLVSDVNRRLNPTQREIAEQRYVGLFQFIDLTKDYFFSYTYDLTRTLQHNMCAAHPVEPTTTSADGPCNVPRKSMYTWNLHLTRELSECIGVDATEYWTLPLTHGAFVQRKCALFGRVVNVALIARRSRHFAGTRYLKRGVSDSGKVANDVELEQIAHEEGVREGVFSSYVQVRGSIPTFWTQETSVTMPKPPIVLNRVDPTYGASQAHLGDLLARYSAPVMVLDLTKQTEKREREMIVSHEFRRAIEHVNAHMPRSRRVRYCALDFSQISKHRQMNILHALEDVAKWTLHETNFFCSRPRTWVDRNSHVHPLQDEEGFVAGPSAKPQRQATQQPLEQRGVMRTNCIDCLDRTNVAQFTVGVHALGRQLATMGTSTSATLESGSQVVLVLMELYSAVGDLISMQYGGSEAHKKMGNNSSVGGSQTQQAQFSNELGALPKHKELLTSIRRYYSNAFTDRLKQDAINVFLGNFVPNDREPPLWDLESDYYLHNFHVQTGTLLSMRARREAWLSSSSDDESDTEDEERTARSSRLAPALSKVAGTTKSTARARVVRRCRRQVETLSKWWRSALENFTRDGASAASCEELALRCDRPVHDDGPHAPWRLAAYRRFERVHQPYKLTQFDKILAHDFFVPIVLARDQNEDSRGDSPRDDETAVQQGAKQPPRRWGSSKDDDSLPRDDDGEASASFEAEELEGDSARPEDEQEGASSQLHETSVLDETASRPPRGGSAGSTGLVVPGRVAARSREDAKRALRRLVRELFPRNARNRARYAASARHSASKADEFEDEDGYDEDVTQRERAREAVCAEAARDDSTFIGALNVSSLECVGEAEYGEYARCAQNHALLLGDDLDGEDASLQCARAHESHAQFAAALRERDLDARDVSLVREISASAGVALALPRGAYVGLRQTTAARDVVAAVHDEITALTGVGRESAARPEQAPLDDEELAATLARLKQRGAAAALDADGVVNQITSQLGSLAHARDAYADLLDADALASQRSRYSSDDSIALYCTYVRAEHWLNDHSMRHILREGVETAYGLATAQSAATPPWTSKETVFSHAAKNEINRAQAELAKRSPVRAPKPEQPGAANGDDMLLIQPEAPTPAHAARLDHAFVQFGQDLFARHDNKYMLFNEAGAIAATLTTL